MAQTPGELTATLILALSQSQEQVKVLQQQTTRIELLSAQNEQLKKELEEAKQTREERQNAFQVDELFQQNAEHRAEIARLKQKLRKYKDKATGRLGIPISSPASVTTSPASPQQARTHSDTTRTAEVEPPPSKRQRVDQALRNVSTNTGRLRNDSTATSKKSLIEKKVAAIPLLTEDGERHSDDAPTTEASGRSKLSKEGSLYKRLDGLLAAPSPGREPLNRAAETPTQDPHAANSSRSSARQYNISNIRHVPKESATPVQTNDRNSTTPLQGTPVTESKARSREKLHPRNHLRSSKHDPPLRERPVEQLKLSDFKPNPRWLDSHGMSYDEFLHGSNKARMEELAKTLPTMPGPKLTDNELLVEFMGPGSEDTVSKLTPMARKNLLNEAKLRRVASAFGKQRADYDRKSDPPGFWNMDMPGTQEDTENRRVAIERDKAEVKRRYDDALSGQGRYVFADELRE